MTPSLSSPRRPEIWFSSGTGSTISTERRMKRDTWQVSVLMEFSVRVFNFSLPPISNEEYLPTSGIEQANFTGKRLKELNFPYTTIVQSSMCRARETAKVISGHLPNVAVQTCDLLQEGAPFPPEPPVGHWKPEFHVILSQLVALTLIKMWAYWLSARFNDIFSSSIATAPVSKRPSASTSTAPKLLRRRTATKSSSATPTSSATLFAGKSAS